MAGKTRAKVVDLICSWEGMNESDGTYKYIIDLYNSLPSDKLPRKTRMLYNWPWCACTWSALAIKLGYTDIMPIEISCSQIVEKAKSMGIWVEDDTYVPNLGDAVLYDWGDNGIGDNVGVPDHIGTVIEVHKDYNSIVVMEGNYSNAVKKRTISINGRYIRGFITPKYDADGDLPVSGNKKSIDTIAREVIAGTWGSGEDRRIKLQVSGYDYAEVQSRVNEILNNPKPQPVVQKEVVAYDKAAKYDKSLSGTYKVTASDYLYMRHGAGTNKQMMAKIPAGTDVQNYGYYSMSNGKKWLYVQVKLTNGVTYTGFCHSSYLRKQ